MKTSIVCISLLSCFFAQANVATHSTQSCQQVQIRVFAPESQRVQFGNGFAVQDNKIVANDHLFGRGDGRIRITLESSAGEPVEYSARLIKRDFHTDLALLVIPEADLRNHGMFPLASCLPYFAKGLVPDELNLIGWQEGESQKKEIPVTLRDPSANDFAIPGVESGYHFQEKNSMRVSKGRSGSLFWSNHEIHGMLFQKNSENFLLAMTAKDLVSNIEGLIGQKKIERNYQYDYDRGVIRFQGVEVPFTREAPKRDDQSPILNGGPHEGRDTVTQSDSQMAEQVVARETQFLSKKSDVQLANANLQSAHEFEQSSPKLAKALRQSGIKQFEIAGIDGIQVTSAFELAKVLGRCRECQITAIHVRESQPESLAEQRMQSIAAARNLVLLIEANSVLRNSGRLLDDATKLYDLLAQIWSDDQIKVSGYQINVQAKELFSKVSSELNKYYLQDSIQENLYVLLSDPFLLMLP